jgi:hypothetical protein
LAALLDALDGNRIRLLRNRLGILSSSHDVALNKMITPFRVMNILCSRTDVLYVYIKPVAPSYRGNGIVYATMVCADRTHAIFKVCNAHSLSRWCDQHDLFRVSCPAKIYAITVEDVHGHQEVSNLGPSWKLAESATSASRIILCKA